MTKSFQASEARFVSFVYLNDKAIPGAFYYTYTFKIHFFHSLELLLLTGKKSGRNFHFGAKEESIELISKLKRHFFDYRSKQ